MNELFPGIFFLLQRAVAFAARWSVRNVSRVGAPDPLERTSSALESGLLVWGRLEQGAALGAVEYRQTARDTGATLEYLCTYALRSLFISSLSQQR